MSQEPMHMTGRMLFVLVTLAEAVIAVAIALTLR